MKKTNSFLIAAFIFLTLFASQHLFSQDESIPVDLYLCIDQSCFNYLSEWEAHLLKWNNTPAGIDWYGITSTNCGHIFTTDLKPGIYYWAIDANPPYMSCWGDAFTISDDGGSYTYVFECALYVNCLRDDGEDNPKNNKTKTETYELMQNYPNPFNPATLISYQIPKTSLVKLVVYDILGQEVKTLVSEIQDAGFYEISFDGSNLPSGVYIYKLQADNFKGSKKMFLIK